MPLLKSKTPEAFKSNLKAELGAGKPMKQSLAIAYAMKRKARKMAAGGQLESGYAELPEESEVENAGAESEDEKDLNQMLAMGGSVVDRIMAKKANCMSEGGRVANGSMTEGLAGFKPNEFDDLVFRDDLESSSDGANNGDFIGNDQESQDRQDMVSRIMRSRAKRDRLPNPR